MRVSVYCVEPCWMLNLGRLLYNIKQGETLYEEEHFFVNLVPSVRVAHRGKPRGRGTGGSPKKYPNRMSSKFLISISFSITGCL